MPRRVRFPIARPRHPPIRVAVARACVSVSRVVEYAAIRAVESDGRRRRPPSADSAIPRGRNPYRVEPATRPRPDASRALRWPRIRVVA